MRSSGVGDAGMAVLMVAVLAFLLSPAQAYSSFRTRVPNGDSSPGNCYACTWHQRTNTPALAHSLSYRLRSCSLYGRGA